MRHADEQDIESGWTPSPGWTPSVVTLKVTCSAAPCQFEGTLSDGMHFYFRARHRGISVGVGRTQEDAVLGTLRSAYVRYGDDDDPHRSSGLDPGDCLPILPVLLGMAYESKHPQQYLETVRELWPEEA